MASAKTINLKVMAQTDAFAKKLAELPGMTEKEAKKAGKKLAQQFEKAEKAAGKNAQNTAKQWDKAFSQLHIGGTKFGSVINALKQPQLALAAGIGAVVTAGFKAAEMMSAYTDGIVNLAASTGMSVEAVAGLEFAAKESGIELNTMTSGMRALAKRAGEAAMKGGTAAVAFQRIGVSVKDSRGQLKDMDALLAEVVDGLAAMGNETESASIAQEILGGRGVALAAAFADGSASLTEWTEKVREAGIVSDEMTAASRMMDEAQAGLAFEWRATTQVIGSEFAPAASKSKDILGGLVKGVRGVVLGLDIMADKAAMMVPAWREAIEAEQDMIDAGELLINVNARIAESIPLITDAGMNLQAALGVSLETALRRSESALMDSIGASQGLSDADIALNRSLRENVIAVEARRDALIEQNAHDETAQANLRRLQAALDGVTRATAEAAEARRAGAEATREQNARDREAESNARRATAANRARAKAQQKWTDQVLRITEGGIAADLTLRLREISEAQREGTITAAQHAILMREAQSAHTNAVRSQAREVEAILEGAHLAEMERAEEKREKDEAELQRTKDIQVARVGAVLEASADLAGILKDRAGDDFKAQQALATTEILLRASVGAVNILSQASGPIVKGAQMVALSAVTAASLAEVASMSPPQMHTGGIVPDERSARLLTGEGVLSRQGVASLGGAGAVHAANAGQGGGSPQVIQMVYKHRVLDTVIRDQLKSDSSLNRAIRGRSRVGHR